MRTPSSSFVVALFAGLVAVLAAPAAQAQCTDTDPATCTDATTISFCSGGTQQTVSCGDVAEGAVCDERGCFGPDCATLDRLDCVSTRGNACHGLASENVNSCQNDDACVTDVVANTETCQARPAGVPVCTQSERSCAGNFLYQCVPFSDADGGLSTPYTVDCRDLGAGFVCQEDGAEAGCQNPACGDAGVGRCDGTTAVTCSEGEETGRENCATFGQACVQDDPESAPECLTVDERCGVNGGGACAGNIATICTGGTFTTETDCAAAGLVCGVVEGTTRTGCIEPGGGDEGEGEGENAAECDRDSDCDDDEECDDGECVDGGGGGGGRRGGGGDEVQPAPGLLSCAEAGSVPVAAVAVVGLAFALRRRRR